MMCGRTYHEQTFYETEVITEFTAGLCDDAYAVLPGSITFSLQAG